MVGQGADSIAVIAGIHGNTWALDAVLQDVARRGVEHMAAPIGRRGSSGAG